MSIEDMETCKHCLWDIREEDGQWRLAWSGGDSPEVCSGNDHHEPA